MTNEALGAAAGPLTGSFGTTADVLAHGLGGRTDLPLNGPAAIVGGGIAVAVSFVAVTKLWSKPWLDPDAGRGIPAFADSARLRAALRALVLVLALFVVAVAFLGPAGTGANLAPWVLYVTFWVGLVPASALLGPVWRVVNPLRTLHRLLPARERPLPTWLGYWPAAGWLLAFVWLELVAPARSDPRLVGAVIVGYAAVNLAAAAVYGPAWFARGDGFEVYSTLIARLSPIGRRADGALVLRNPLAGLVRADTEPGLAAVACVLVGATAFDGLTRTTCWQAVPGSGSTLVATTGLAGSIALVSALYAGAMTISARVSGTGAALTGLFAPTLLPIALGYAVAHYFSFFLLEGQMPFLLAADPFGATGARVDYRLLAPEVVATVQINAIVLGHIASTAAAHDQALRLFPPRRARRGQVPVVIAMVLLTCTGLLLLLSG
ncbi:hypothetical protein A8924_1560 [Saccharopolyspora erythraea NRRL 2338]|uniref:Uncharacterized protein n=1 Tax=Saccharopolyspora erythraea TaxID=1836 RepID=A0ABP3N458_SACER|nr:hypothetical protein [Saccharopolyspora erythraea]EQD86770.1 hypothetical protein N599_07820 [Saccharopolyspora erythraea D]PFG94289.1 hypothetical protein A8924_1560 [Saccharopolyspora erythraea NRRL 2338]QRK91059.1 hypothetical protein JQX30_06350 [Saccharopolyspora erythraea]